MSFFDVSSADLSSRMSITLTVILTIAVSSRPACIAKSRYVTFYDRFMLLSLAIAAFMSCANVISVRKCGGHNSDAPPFMQEEYEINKQSCEVGWCSSTKLDCSIFLATLLIWGFSVTYVVFATWRDRSKITQRLIGANEGETMAH